MSGNVIRAVVVTIGLGGGMAAGAAGAQETSTVPARGFYLGLGGAFAGVRFGAQDVYAVGTSEIYQDGLLEATGEAAGPARFDMNDENSFAPSAQAGYFQRIPGGDWLWGGKVSWAYLDTSSSLRNVLLPQAGSFTYTDDNETVPFTGTAVIRNYRTSITHQMTLTPFVGRSFDRGFAYLGVGPTLSRTRTDLEGLVGFADINGDRQDISGEPQDFTGSNWVWGGAATVGATYFFNPSWFVDVSYSYARSRNYTSDYSSTFQNPGADGRLTEGALVGDSSAKVVTQGVTVTMNWAF